MTTSDPAAPSGLPLPRALGRYMLFDRIGKGGMAEIFLARTTTELGGSRLVVVKLILPHLADSTRFSDLLVTEAKLAARLTHANIAQVLDLGRQDGVLYIAMQYVEGFDLNELLRRCAKSKTPMPVEYSLLVVVEMLRALDYAHRRTSDDGKPLGIVHRDVSPSNVLLSLDGEIKLCDFGIARANDVAEVLPEDAVKGKAGYMSPEHARGEPIDARADLFAAGIVLWELLAGRRMYRAGKGAGPSLLDLASEGNVPPLEPRGLPNEAELHGIVAKALARDREQRFPTAQAMLRELEGYVARAGLVASPIKLGDWLREQFGTELIEQRRARERAARALEAGPLVVIEPIARPEPAPPVAAAVAEPPPPQLVAPAPPHPPAAEAATSSVEPASNASSGGARWGFVALAIVLAGAGYAFAHWLK